MSPLLFILTTLTTAVYGGLADPGGHTTFLHDNSSLRYSDFTNEPACAGDASLEPCRNKWWIQENKSDFAAVIQGTHSTAGPSASMSATFTGSTVVWLRGQRDPSVEVLSSINGAPVSKAAVESIPATFSLLIDGLDPEAVNTFSVKYAGSGILSVVVLFLDANGRAASPPEAYNNHYPLVILVNTSVDY
ncbi:hypothetical protein AURDEDRAFT_167984 [Auricularia subglabra TFB-10046 SS5]|nr:hypothetical protein AURDEDRAFT_167984 [Auricularia subglabra TFB-10046 SS5]